MRENSIICKLSEHHYNTNSSYGCITPALKKYILIFFLSFFLSHSDAPLPILLASLHAGVHL